MNHKKAACFLVVLFGLLGNAGAINSANSNRLISCRADRKNQKYICIKDAVAEAKGHIRNGSTIYIVAYGKGGSEKTRCDGDRIAASFRRQLINAMVLEGISVDGSLVQAVDGGYRDEAWIEVYAGEPSAISAKWPPDC